MFGQSDRKQPSINVRFHFYQLRKAFQLHPKFYHVGPDKDGLARRHVNLKDKMSEKFAGQGHPVSQVLL